MKKIYFIAVSIVGIAVVASGGIFVATRHQQTVPIAEDSAPFLPESSASAVPVAPVISDSPSPINFAEPIISFVGPREQIPKDAPVAYGFWSFAYVVPGVLSRSGQPLANEFTYLADHGWKSDINLRVDGEWGESADDAVLAGFQKTGLKYLRIPILDGHAPTDAQAQEFLDFVKNPANQPVHVHCRGGIGRAGTMVALYRYSVQGWPLDKAIEESRAFHGGISAVQASWLKLWAQAHPAGV